jgi:putative transposase
LKQEFSRKLLERTEAMKKSRFREEQIIGILKQHESRGKTADLCREHGISAATFYGWKQKFGGMDVSEAQRLRALEDEKRRLKLLMAELSIHGEALKGVIRKTAGACRAEGRYCARIGRVSAKRAQGLQAAGQRTGRLSWLTTSQANRCRTDTSRASTDCDATSA